MKITKKTKGIILAGVVALTINAAATIINVGGVITGGVTQQSSSRAIDPPGD